MIIQPTHRSAKRQYYEAILNGEVIVAKSTDPVHAACRAMKAKGLFGRVEFYRPGGPYPSLIVHDLDKAAMLRVVETEREGPVIKKWRPFEMNGRHALRTKRLPQAPALRKAAVILPASEALTELHEKEAQDHHRHLRVLSEAP